MRRLEHGRRRINKHRIWPISHHRRQGGIHLGRVRHSDRHYRDVERGRDPLTVRKECGRCLIGGVEKDCHATGARHDFLEELKCLRVQIE
jgi:hypothetical protein